MSHVDQIELYEFTGEIDYHDFGRMGYTVVYLPESLRKELPFDKYPRLRVDAEIAEHVIDGAFQPGQGKMYLILSKAFLKSAGLSLGDEVEVMFRIADQGLVDIPDALRAAFKKNRRAAKAWDALSAGKKRALVHRVRSAKRADTIARRVDEVLLQLCDA